MPLVLAGRDAQLTQIKGQLGGVATFGQFVGRIRVETGPRGVGKTSLLAAVREAAAESGFVTVWVTARDDESLVAQLVHGLLAGLDQIGVTVHHEKRFRDRVRWLELELGLGPAKAGVGLDLADESAGATPAAAALRELMSWSATGARERGSAGLCLLVDELQASTPRDLRTLAYAWQEMQVHQDPPAAALYAAGLSNTPDVLTDAVTFAERFAFRTLERLTDAEAAEALVRTSETLGVSWEPAAVENVVQLAQGYPYFIQLYGDSMWQVATPSTDDVLTVAHLEQAEHIVAVDTQSMFRSRWAKASPREQQLLAAMAEWGDEPVRRGDLAQSLGVTTSELSVPRRRLLDKGLIESAGHGRLRFTTPGFARFIRDEVGGG